MNTCKYGGSQRFIGPLQLFEMHQPRDFEFEDNSPPVTLSEQREMLLHYFVQILAKMGEAEVAALRIQFIARFPAGSDLASIAEIIDGHLALRGVQGRKEWYAKY